MLKITKGTQAQLVEAVKVHARANYEKEGWDYIVETHSDEDIAEIIGKTTVVASAISKVRKVAKMHNSVRADVQAGTF